MVTEPVLYAGSDGRYYTEWQVSHRIRSGTWALCLRDRTDGRWLVETGVNELLSLTVIGPSALPEWAEVRAGDETVYVVDTRRSLP